MSKFDGTTIAHLINPSGLYGKEKWLLALHAHIDKNRYHSFIIIMRNGKEEHFESALRERGINCFCIDSRGRFNLKCLSEIEAILNRQGTDIIHSHGYKSDFYALLLKYRMNIPIVSTPHGFSNAPDIKLKIYEAIDRFILRRFNLVAPLSSQLAADLKHIKRNNIVLIENFVDLDETSESGEYDENLVTYAGRLTWLKRVKDAIEAVSLLENVRLQIVGDGELRKDLENQSSRLGIADRVDFLGFRSDVLRCLGNSSILILPSLTEGMSRITMEAMALGKPVVGTDIPGIRDLVEDGRTGILVPKKNPRRIADAINRILADKSIYNSMSTRARKIIVSRFSAARGAKEYEDLYDSLRTNTTRRDH